MHLKLPYISGAHVQAPRTRFRRNKPPVLRHGICILQRFRVSRQHPQLECHQRKWNPSVRTDPISPPRRVLTNSSYGSDDRCDSYSVSMSFPGLPLESPVSFLFHPPDCDGLIELSFPLASDFPAGMACLIKYVLSTPPCCRPILTHDQQLRRRFCQRYNDPRQQPEQFDLAQRPAHHQWNCILYTRRRGGHENIFAGVTPAAKLHCA